MEYIETRDGCAANFQTQPRLLVCSTPMHMGRIDTEHYDRTWKIIDDRHSTTADQTMEEEKDNETALLKKQSKENPLVKESIVEQMKEKQMQQNEAIVL